MFVCVCMFLCICVCVCVCVSVNVFVCECLCCLTTIWDPKDLYERSRNDGKGRIVKEASGSEKKRNIHLYIGKFKKLADEATKLVLLK